MAGRSIGLGWILLLATAAPVTHAQAAAPRAARDLERGHALAPEDIRAEPTDSASVKLTGWVTRRVVRAGEALRAPAIAPPPLVRAGETVSVRLVSAGMTVAREGTAMMTGALGDHVRIRIDGQHSVTGLVAGPSTVRIP